MSGESDPSHDPESESTYRRGASETMDNQGRPCRTGCQAALHDLGGKKSANQPQSWTPAGFGIVRDKQIVLLESFAKREGLFLPIESLGPRHGGRMEHAIFGLPVDGELIYKVTKGPKFGFYPQCPNHLISTSFTELVELRPATPAQYLLRLEVWEELAPGLTRFEGFTRLDGHFGIVTSQPWFEARNATWKEISDHLSAKGFLPVRAYHYDDPTCWYHPCQNLALFDVGTSNVIWTNGLLLPIDIIPMHPEGIIKSHLHAALGLAD